MKQKTLAPQKPAQTQIGLPALDIVVPFTTLPLTRAALAVASHLSEGLKPLIRLVKMQTVPFPLQLENSPVCTATLRAQFAPLAEKFGAHLQFCSTRDPREGLLYAAGENSVVVIASRRRWWKTREERLAGWLRRHGRNVVLNYMEKNNA